MAKATDRAYDWVRERILSGEYASGSHLQEERIAEEAKVSRTPVREALRRLGNEHFVKFVPNQGAFVTTWREDDVEVIFELRAMLEGFAAQRAAERISPDQIDELDHCTNEIERLCRVHSPENHRRSLEFNQRFHGIVADAAGSERMRRMLSWLVEIPLILRTMDRYSNIDVDRSNHHHRELVEAFRARDGNWARSVMETHLRAARQVYLARGADDQAALIGAEVMRMRRK